MAETVKVLQRKNCISRIHIRERTEEEEKKYQERIRLATQKFLSEVERIKSQSKEKSA